VGLSRNSNRSHVDSQHQPDKPELRQRDNGYSLWDAKRHHNEHRQRKCHNLTNHRERCGLLSDRWKHARDALSVAEHHAVRSVQPNSGGKCKRQHLDIKQRERITASVTLSGTGVALVQHFVALTWNASTSTVSGYNVYRSTVSGSSYTKINSTLVAVLSYSDATVQNNTTYYYVTTSVDSSALRALTRIR